ncbi:MAG: hypothetical protein AB1742_14495 [bacterium]
MAVVVFGAVVRLVRGGAVMMRENFRGERIPSGAGLGFALLGVVYFTPHVIYGFVDRLFSTAALLLMVGFGFLGLMDDVLREREAGGLTGHMRRFVCGGIFSTALVKCVFGLALSGAAVSLLPGEGGVRTIAANTLLVALCANAVNVLDVRPGRALKGFWGMFFVFFVLAPIFPLFPAAVVFDFLYVHVLGGSTGEFKAVMYDVAGYRLWSSMWILFPVLVWSMAYGRWDFRCEAMMGDAGSNALGAAAGLLIAWNCFFTWKAAVLALLVVVHAAAEFSSISKLIEAVPPLRWLDRLGVRPAGRV